MACASLQLDLVGESELAAPSLAGSWPGYY
jgi:hypothetical protein